MTLEGAHVQVVAELMPYSGGLKRNIVQCLDDFGIPLKLSHTVVDIQGRERVTGVTLAQVDENRCPIPGTEKYYPCDTLLLSVGLIPENELSRAAGVELSPSTNGPMVDESFETSIPGVFACGNVLHVHDLVDFVSQEAASAGKAAAKFLKSDTSSSGRKICLSANHGVRYTVPAYIHPERMDDSITVRFRVSDVYRNVSIIATANNGKQLYRRKRLIVSPGEMEEITLQKSDLLLSNDITDICITLEVLQ